MISIYCHCKNVEITFNQIPSHVRDCDCPMCNRLGALWGDYKVADVTVIMRTPTVTYQWGDKDYEMHHCPECGCSTHYTSTAPVSADEIGINLRMLDRRQLELIPIKT